MSPLTTKKKKLLEIIKDLSTSHIDELITYAKHLKNIDINKTKSFQKTERIKIPTFHLGHIVKNATDRESLYEEYLNHKFD